MRLRARCFPESAAHIFVILVELDGADEAEDLVVALLALEEQVAGQALDYFGDRSSFFGAHGRNLEAFVVRVSRVHETVLVRSRSAHRVVLYSCSHVVLSLAALLRLAFVVILGDRGSLQMTVVVVRIWIPSLLRLRMREVCLRPFHVRVALK